MRTSSTTRLITMIAFAVVLFMIIQRARDPSLWEWAVPNHAEDKSTVASNTVASNTVAGNIAHPKKPPEGASKTSVQLAQASAPQSPQTSPATASDGSKTEPSPAVESGNKPTTLAADNPPIEAPLPAPKVTGPTDEDPDEIADYKENVQAVSDGTLFWQREEKNFRNQIARWVLAQPLDVLKQRAKPNSRFTWFATHANEQRGKLFALELDLRRDELYPLDGVYPLGGDDNDDPIQVVEAWGFTNESRGWPYAIMIVDPPADFPVKANIAEKATFYGYFLKMQGYQPGSAKPGAEPLTAPLLIGRIVWHPVQKVESAGLDWIVVALAGVALGLFVLVRLYMAMTGHRKAPFAPANLIPRSKTPESEVQAWLDEAYTGDGGDENPENEGNNWESDHDNHSGSNGSG